MIVGTIDEKIRRVLSWKNVMSDTILRNSSMCISIDIYLTFNIQHTIIIRSVFVNKVSSRRNFCSECSALVVLPVHKGKL